MNCRISLHYTPDSAIPRPWSWSYYRFTFNVIVNGWHVELTSNNSHDSLYLKNDNVSGAITKFQLKVSYSTKEIQEVTYYVIDVQVTEDFVLPSEPGKCSMIAQAVSWH